METIETKTVDEKQDKRQKAIIDLEWTLLRTSWVKEAELIKEFVPHEDLTKTQLRLLDKCIDKEEFTEKQLSELKLLLNKYRAILQKIKPDDVIDNIDTTVKMIETEADFIRMMSNEQQKLTVQIDTFTGKKRFEFEVLPLTDSRIVDSLELQVDLFRDFTVEEQTIYSKYNVGQELTHEEQAIYERMNKQIMEKQSKERISTINVFLANQLKIKNSNSTLEQRIKFWEVFPLTSKVGVFLRVQELLGLNDVKNSELFPTR